MHAQVNTYAGITPNSPKVKETPVQKFQAGKTHKHKVPQPNEGYWYLHKHTKPIALVGLGKTQ